MSISREVCFRSVRYPLTLLTRVRVVALNYGRKSIADWFNGHFRIRELTHHTS